MSEKIDAIQFAYRVLDGDMTERETFTYEEMWAVCCYLDGVIHENLAFIDQAQHRAEPPARHNPRQKDF